MVRRVASHSTRCRQVVHLGRGRPAIHPLDDQTVGNHHQLAGRCSLPPEGTGHRPTHGHHAIGSERRQPILEEERPRNLTSGEYEGDPEPAPDGQADQGLAIARALRIHQVDGVSSEKAGQSGGVGLAPPRVEGQRQDLESPCSRERLHLGIRGAHEPDAHAGPRESQAEMQCGGD